MHIDEMLLANQSESTSTWRVNSKITENSFINYSTHNILNRIVHSKATMMMNRMGMCKIRCLEQIFSFSRLKLYFLHNQLSKWSHFLYSNLCYGVRSKLKTGNVKKLAMCGNKFQTFSMLQPRWWCSGNEEKNKIKP